MTEDNESLTKSEPEAGPEAEPEPEAGPEPEPEAVLINVQVPVTVNDALKALANLWGETKKVTATKLLTGAIQRHYQINKSCGRI